MTEEEYRERVGENELTDDLIYIFNFFERYISEGENIDTLDYAQIKEDIRGERILEKISNIRRNNNTKSLGYSYLRSFQINTRQFIDENTTRENARIKLKKVLLSYKNVSRFQMEDVKIIDNIIENNCPNSEKIMFLVSLVDIELDDIGVNREIEYIVNACKNSTVYYALPAFGCTVDVFGSTMKKYPFNMLHLAGHCNNQNKKNEYRIIFMDNDGGIRYDKFINRLNGNEEMVFLNCCNTYEFVNGNGISNVNTTIVHEGVVNVNDAKNVGETFYDYLFTQDQTAAWNAIQNIEIPFHYCIL